MAQKPIDLSGLPKWQLIEQKLYQHFRFNSFEDAMRFFQLVANYCEQVDHHPNWENCYRDVKVWLWTHDHNDVTQKDIELAQFMQRIADELLQTK